MTRRQIIKRTEELQQKMGLSNWDIAILFSDVKKFKRKNKRQYYQFVAHTVSQPQYKLGTITYNPQKLKLIDDNVIVHELLHVVMSPLIMTAKETSKEVDSIEYYNEMVTSEIERIIMRFKK